MADQVALAINHARLFGQLQQQALTDSVTGCFNRRAFEMQLERDLHLASHMRQPVTLLIIELDHFKSINATYGQKTGDEILRSSADIIREEIRGVDTLARFGNVDFSLIMPQAGHEAASVVGELIRERIEKKQFSKIGHVTASLGLATFPHHASSSNEIVEAAYRALNTAKQLGRNRVITPEPKDELRSDSN